MKESKEIKFVDGKFILRTIIEEEISKEQAFYLMYRQRSIQQDLKSNNKLTNKQVKYYNNIINVFNYIFDKETVSLCENIYNRKQILQEEIKPVCETLERVIKGYNFLINNIKL